MIKKILITVLLLCSTALFAKVMYPAYATPYYPSDIKSPLNVYQNQTFHINFKANPKSACQWHIVKYDKNLITYVGHQYIDPKKTYKPWVGPAGYDVWAFRARSGDFSVVQVGHIVMQYGCQNDTKEVKTETYIVHVSTKAFCIRGAPSKPHCLKGSAYY